MSRINQRNIHVVATSHGTDDSHGQQSIHELRAQLEALSAQQLSEKLIWHEAYVDVQQPRLDEVIANLPAGEPAVVLPLLVSDGVHTTEDIAQAVATRPNTFAAQPLGPLSELAKLLALRATEHVRDDSTVVLAAAGTRLQVGQKQVNELATQVAELLGREVLVGYCAGAEPKVTAVVAAAKPGSVLLLSTLLADGFFQKKLSSTGAETVTSPLLPDVTIAQCFVVRLENALQQVFFVS